MHADRRIVTLHSTPGIHATADAFFDPLDERITAVAAAYEPEILEQFITFLHQLHQTIENYKSDRERNA